jgi:NAD(P)-binding Rossmann-like domain
MREIDTDYLLVGAGASAMAFVDALLAQTDARVVLVDRRHRPGGHWLDAYGFVRLHQPSAYYGVASQRLGHDRIDESGGNEGWYERATADEICDYYGQVLEQDFVSSGRVRFLPMCEYRGEDTEGHHVVSLLTNEDTTIRARTLVDATYVQSEVPSQRRPDYAIDPGVRVVAPNDLVHLGGAPDGFTVIGAGKTAMDTCCWLLEAGVDPERIRWIRARDPWLFDRAFMQPLELVGSFMQMQARWVGAAADAVDGDDFAHRLEASRVFVRIDPTVEPRSWRGATISRGEIDALRSIARVERAGYVRRIGRQSLVLSRDDVGTELPTTSDELYVDCTAPGVRATAARPVFSGDRILLQYVTVGLVPWSAATIGYVEATRDDDREKNRLCPVLTFEADVAGALRTAYAGMRGRAARRTEQDIGAWTEACRLNPGAGARSHADEPDVASALTSMAKDFGPAMANLAHRVATTPTERLLR